MSLTNEIKFLARNIEITDEDSKRIQLGGFLTYQEAVKLQKAYAENGTDLEAFLDCDELRLGDFQKPEHSYIVYSPIAKTAIHDEDYKVISVEFKPTPIYSFANTLLENGVRDISKIIRYDRFDLVRANIDSRAFVKTKCLDVVIASKIYTDPEDEEYGFPIKLHIVYECSADNTSATMAVTFVESSSWRFSKARTNSITMNTSTGASFKDNLNARFMEKALQVNFSDYIIGAIDYLNGELSGICGDLRNYALLMLNKVTFNSEYTSKIEIPSEAEQVAAWY